jgi:hypothetical protein
LRLTDLAQFANLFFSDSEIDVWEPDPIPVPFIKTKHLIFFLRFSPTNPAQKISVIDPNH